MTDIMTEILNYTDLPGTEGESIVVYQPLELKEVESNPSDRTTDLENDYKLVRQNMHYQQQMILDVAKIFLETAKNSDTPKHMDAFSNLMAQFSSSNEKLLKLHKEMKDITSTETKIPSPPQGQINIENAKVFMGGPSDLMDHFGDAFETQHGAIEDQ